MIILCTKLLVALEGLPVWDTLFPLSLSQTARKYEAMRWLMMFAIGVTVGLVGASLLPGLLHHVLVAGSPRGCTLWLECAVKGACRGRSLQLTLTLTSWCSSVCERVKTLSVSPSLSPPPSFSWASSSISSSTCSPRSSSLWWEIVSLTAL